MSQGLQRSGTPVIARASLAVADPTSDAGLGIYDEQSAVKFVRLVE